MWAHLCFLECGKAKQRRCQWRTRQRARLGCAEVASRRVGSMGSQQGCGSIQHLLRVEESASTPCTRRAKMAAMRHLSGLLPPFSATEKGTVDSAGAARRQ